MKRFGEYIHWLNTGEINEAINAQEIISMAKTIGDSIDNEVPLTSITLIRNITKSPQVVSIEKKTGKDAGPAGFPNASGARDIGTNYKTYFGKLADQFVDAEALIYDFATDGGYSHQSFFIYLGFMANGKKLAAFALPPYYYYKGARSQGIASTFPKLTMILRQFGFKVHGQGADKEDELGKDPEDLEFLNKLIGVFRWLSSRYASLPIKGSEWNEAKQGFYELQQEMPQQYQNYIQQIQKAFPSGARGRRKIDLAPTLELTTPKGEKVQIQEAAKTGVQVYYPNWHVMSQWTVGEMDPSTMKTALGGGGAGTIPYLFSGRIPGNKIVYSQSILPTGLSQIMVEGEMIVDHNPGQASGGSLPPFDKDIICTVTQMSDYKWDGPYNDSVNHLQRYQNWKVMKEWDEAVYRQRWLKS